MDLWEPVKDSNDYGGRAKKNLKTGKLTDKSYVPFGLTKAQYEKIRSEEAAKKDANYQRNVKKAGVFTDYTDFYKKRGTAENGSWMKLPNRGHEMAKTKYDWSGEKVRVNFFLSSEGLFIYGLCVYCLYTYVFFTHKILFVRKPTYLLIGPQQ